MKEYIRKVIFKIGKNVFTLTLFETNSDKLKYEFKHNNKIIFEGQDFRPSPLYAIDSNETVKCLLGFLTLRYGDTDKEYFANYTKDQIEFMENFAEDLQIQVFDRFGYD